MKMKLLAPAVAATALAVGAAPASAGTVTASSGGLTATLRAGTHHPKVNKKWPIKVTATYKGRSAHGVGAYYQFLYNGRQVATRGVCPNQGQMNCSNYGFKFNGHYTDTLMFPPESLGFALTVRVVVSYAHRTVYLPYDVKTAR